MTKYKNLGIPETILEFQNVDIVLQIRKFVYLNILICWGDGMVYMYAWGAYAVRLGGSSPLSSN